MQATKPQQGVQQFTLNASVAAMKNSLRIALSTIAFQRELFPEKAFVPKSYCGTELFMLKPAAKDPNTSTVHVQSTAAFEFCEYLEKGVFEAIEKRYVQRVMVNVHSSDPSSSADEEQGESDILETYSFKIDYNEERIAGESDQRKGSGFLRRDSHGATGSEGRSGVSSRQEVAKQTRLMIRKLSSVITGLGELPDRKWLTVYLSYNDSTPAGYEPPNFKAIGLEKLPTYSRDPDQYLIGNTNTGYHSLELKIKCAPNQDEPGVAEAEESAVAEVPSQEDPPMSKESDIKASTTAADTLSHWQKVREGLYESIAQEIAAETGKREPEDVARDAFAKSEWGYSFSDNVKNDIMQQLEANGCFKAKKNTNSKSIPVKYGRNQHRNLPLQELARNERALDPSMSSNLSQTDSFVGDRENFSKISCAKRAVPCQPLNSMQHKKKNRVR